MDATRFRQRAADAREMALFGDDVRLSRMLLDVAVDLDAEAEAIEAEKLARLQRIALTDGSTTVAVTGREAG